MFNCRWYDGDAVTTTTISRWQRCAFRGIYRVIAALSPHPEERAIARVSKDEASIWASWFETALRASSP
jgi:hypothetical protein